jgi:hypothetical protein
LHVLVEFPGKRLINLNRIVGISTTEIVSMSNLWELCAIDRLADAIQYTKGRDLLVGPCYGIEKR